MTTVVGLVGDGVRSGRVTAMLRRLGAVLAALATLTAMFVLAIGAPAQAASSGDGGGSAAATARHDLAVGIDHACAIDAGDVRCWGTNTKGDLGYGNTADVTNPQSAAVVDIGGKAVSIAVSDNHSCALRDDGKVLCWGSGAEGQLGYGNTDDIGDDETPASAGTVNLGASAKAISVGPDDTCAVLANGKIRCWGSAALGKLGYDNGVIGGPESEYALEHGENFADHGILPYQDLDVGDDEVPASMPAIDPGGEAIDVATAYRQTCALLSTGGVQCWGMDDETLTYTGAGCDSSQHDNSRCWTGDSNPTKQSHQALPGGLHGVSISAGTDHMCVVLDNGQVACWGANDQGQLGAPRHTYPYTPYVPDLGGYRALAVSAYQDSTCIVTTAGGKVRCWGNGVYSPDFVSRNLPLAARSLGIVTTNNGCARLVDGSVKCWGTAVGSGTLVPPVYVRQLASGKYFTCALINNGSVRCWGQNTYGQLGQGNTTNIGGSPASLPSSVPAVDLGGYARSITAGSNHVCVVMGDGDVRCWGLNGSGQLGYGNANNIGDNETPASAGVVGLPAGKKAIALAAGDQHTCAVYDDGSVSCWGRASEGELGNGTTAWVGMGSISVAAGKGANFDSVEHAKAITAGYQHTCVLFGNGRVKCWGRGDNGRLGYGNTRTIGDNEGEQSVDPVQLGTGREVVAIAAGDHHTCAALDNGDVRCWGMGANGRLGYGNQNDIGDNEQPSSAGPVPLGQGVIGLAGGGAHSCALRVDGSVVCWGHGGNGRLGDGNTLSVGDDESVAPFGAGTGVGLPGCTTLSDGEVQCLTASGRATQVTAGSNWTCALLSDGQVTCWGAGAPYGQLGYGNLNDVGDTPAVTWPLLKDTVHVLP